MLDNAFKLTLDQVWPPHQLKESDRECVPETFAVDGYPNDQNLWGESFY